MLAVSAAFPLTSDQPPVAVAPVAQLMRLLPGGTGASQPRGALPALAALYRGAEAPRPDDALASAPLPPARDPYAISGPPPAFDANVLDIERRFEAVLARIELARAQRELRLGSAAGRDTALRPGPASEAAGGRWPDQGSPGAEGPDKDDPAARPLPLDHRPAQSAEIIRFSPLHTSWRSRMTTAEPEAPLQLARAV